MLYSALLQVCKQRVTSDGQNSEMVVPVSTFMVLLRAALVSTEFDEDWYVENYRDVAAAIREGRVASGREHFLTQGYFEHRLPRELQVDETYYREENPDVNEAILKGEVASGHEHFYTAGRFEGRAPFKNFTMFDNPGPIGRRD